MIEDAWYNAFVPRSHASQEKPKHRRRQSLLQQPNEKDQADVEPVEVIAEVPEDSDKSNGPPEATVARRAKSYSDFYDVVRAHIKKERALEKGSRRRSRENIKSELDFSEWYSGVSEELLDASHEQYQVYDDQLLLAQSHLDSLLSDASSALDVLSQLSESFKAVEDQTTAFQSQCEGLVGEQKRISKLADEIAENLQYYAYLEPITRRLNAPGAGNFVRRKDFLDMLVNLDNCLDYMQAHPNQLESATYRSRYRLLLTRALTLIRVHFTNTLREIAADVSKRIADRQLNDTTMSALLYAKFRVGAPELKQLGLEIQKRAVPPPGSEPGTEAEYQSLMNELFQSYSATRGRLILPLVAKKMGEIAMAPSTSKDLVAFARSSIGYIRGICFDEYDLWGEWFDTEDGLYAFLESICEPLFDHLRPRTIHESQMTKLCELCTLIQTRYVEEEDEDDEPPSTKKLDFSLLVQPALQDAQSRLVFLVMSSLRVDIEQYKPKPEDLAYPRKAGQTSLSGTKNGPVLSGRKSSNGPLTPLPKNPTVVEGAEEDGFGAFSTDTVLRDCYPTLRKAIWLLSKIYRLVNSTVFDDLAHQIVHATTLSLLHAAATLTPRTSPTDAQLFLTSHLLTLKQQIVAFDIEFVSPDIHFDFSSVTSTFYELRTRGGLFNPASWVRLATGGLVPRVVENMLDAKAELDGRLRTVINDFTSSFANRIAAPIASSSAGKKNFDPKQATEAVRSNAEKEVVFLRKKLDEYLDDVRTKETLVAAVQDQVMNLYEEWYETYLNEGATNGKPRRKSKGKGREDDVWDPETFEDWCEGVFNVGRLGMVGDGENGDGVSVGTARSDSPSL